MLSLQEMAVNPGITFCEPGWIAGEVTLQHRNTVIVGIEIVFPVSQLTGRIQLLAKSIIPPAEDFKTGTGGSINVFFTRYSDSITDLLKRVTESVLSFRAVNMSFPQLNS